MVATNLNDQDSIMKADARARPAVTMLVIERAIERAIENAFIGVIDLGIATATATDTDLAAADTDLLAADADLLAVNRARRDVSPPL